MNVDNEIKDVKITVGDITVGVNKQGPFAYYGEQKIPIGSLDDYGW